MDREQGNGFSAFGGKLVVVLKTALITISLRLFLIGGCIVSKKVIKLDVVLSRIFRMSINTLVLLVGLPFLITNFFFLKKEFLILDLFTDSILTKRACVLTPFGRIAGRPLLVVVLKNLLLKVKINLVVQFKTYLSKARILTVLFDRHLPLAVKRYVLVVGAFVFKDSMFLFNVARTTCSLTAFFITCGAVSAVVVGAWVFSGGLVNRIRPGSWGH